MKTLMCTSLFLAAAGAACAVPADGDGDADGGGSGSGSGSGSGDGGGGDSVTCGARLIAGSTTFNRETDPTQWNAAGHPAKAEPPMRLFNLAGRGSQLLVSTDASVWLMDAAAAAPSFKRVFGDDTTTPAQYQPTGACSAGRVMAGDGLAWLPDGRAVIGDAWGNGVIEMSDPTSASCQVRPIAGTQVAIDTGDLMSGQIYEAGDVTGPGAQARFRRPDDATGDAQGNVYVYDDSNMSVKKIASDAARTVTKLADLPAEMNTINSMTAMGGKLYVGGGMSGGDKIVEIDTATGAQRTVVSGAAFPGAAGRTGVPIAMTNDGTNLYVYLWMGYVYRVTPSGAVTFIAGKGAPSTSTEVRELNTAGTIAGSTLPLAFTGMVHGANLYWNAGHLYVPAQYNYADALWDITCE
jgi:hypothetical protein